MAGQGDDFDAEVSQILNPPSEFRADDISSTASGDSSITMPAIEEDDSPVLRLPWRRMPSMLGEFVGADVTAKPGEFVLQSLFLEFCVSVEKKIEHVLAESLEKPLAKTLQRGEDVPFDQLLTALGNVSEQCLPSLLQTLFQWYNKQMSQDDASAMDLRQRHRSRGSRDFLCERRDMAVEFVYCLVLIEVLSKLSYHPGHDDLVTVIISHAFSHFKYRDSIQSSPNSSNVSIITDLYAEVIGVLAQSRFPAVRKRFTSELKELKLRDQTPYTAQSIISLLMGLKFFRIKMHPIEEFEACVQFLNELARYYLEVNNRDIKHALAGLFVEILLPVAASAKNEVNVPVLKTFVEMLYTTTIDMSTRKKHTLALYPLVTCLLCVSHKQFFLSNWPYFLTMCLSALKNKDTKMSRVALESLYRLLWVYMVRIKCESNTATQSRLQSIVNSLFPKGSKQVTPSPKDTPLNIFVKIIQFIAKERLDFAMKEIIFDLLCVGRQIKFLTVTPERMSIGLRAFLVISDSLQQKDGDPPMPQTTVALPSGNTMRHKKTFLNKMLTDSTARLIGLSLYYPHILKTFDSILRALDLQVGRPLLLTKAENVNKEPDEVLTTDRKPKIELFRTCIAAIPRLIPDGMTCSELIEMLTRLTVHVDEELKGLAFQSLQNLMQESVDWREHVLRGFVAFIQKEILDTNVAMLDGALRMIIQLLVHWKTGAASLSSQSFRDKQFAEVRGVDKASAGRDQTKSVSHSLAALHETEGLALVMLSHCRPVTRKLALHMLREVRTIISNQTSLQSCEPSLIDVLDTSCSAVVERLLPTLPASERSVVLTHPNMDLSWALDRASTVWSQSSHCNIPSGGYSGFHRADPWMSVLAGLVTQEFAMGQCPHAVSFAWPLVHGRLQNLFTLVDPSLQTNENRASSILRSGSKKVTTERDVHMSLWHNYVILACSIAQKSASVLHRCASPEISSSPDSCSSDKPDARQISGASTSTATAASLFHLLVPLIKCDCAEMRDSVAVALGHSNPEVFRDFVEEVQPYVREAIDKKQDNLKRKRKRDLLRLQLVKIFEILATKGTFAHIAAEVIDKEHRCLTSTFVDYIDGARQYLEAESERDVLQDIRFHFSGFVHHLIKNTPVELRETLISRDLRYGLFHLFARWSGRFCPTVSAVDTRQDEKCSDLELASAHAMSSVLCCGLVFDPSGLNDDAYVYNWLDILLSSHDEKIYQLAKETIVLLLDFNAEVQGLLDWVIDRCYTGSYEVADGCFGALAAVFQNREYPCDHVAMLTLAILNVGSPRYHVHEMAVQLLHLLDARFFQEESVFSESGEENMSQPQTLNDVLLSVAYCRAQLFVSEQLARLHPELTMPIFSEITHRFESAKPSVQETLLKFLLPWLQNLELVDTSLPPSNPLSNFLTRLQESQGDLFKAALKGEGWGSTQATEMVLNNLFYITVKFGDEHQQEIELLWASLVSSWPQNLKVIMRYLLIMTSVAADLLLYAQRVATFLSRTKPEKLVDELMNELQTVETLNMTIERTQTPPFYRLSPLRKTSAPPNTTDDEKMVTHTIDTTLEKGMLHTKRHSALCDDVPDESTPRTDSTASLRSVSSTSSEHISTEEDCGGGNRMGDNRRSESPVPYPLPMPAYGGYFAPLSGYLPESFIPTPGYHRSNVAVMLLCELVTDGLDIDWSAHLPLMLHIIFLGLDHPKCLVYEHCKHLLLNLLQLLAAYENGIIARTLLKYKSPLGHSVIQTCPEYRVQSTSNQTVSADSLQRLQTDSTASSSDCSPMVRSSPSVESNATLTPDTPLMEPILGGSPDQDVFSSVEEAIQVLLDLFAQRRDKPLWSYEDITSRTLSIQSAVLLEHVLKCIVYICKQLAPMALVEQRWSQIALQLALSCSSRHYAGRSFQIVRALRVRATTQMLSDVLSRLVETVAEQGDDMQGYVTEIMLTLEATVDNLDLDLRPTDFVRELFISTPNLAKETWAENRKSTPVPLTSAAAVLRDPPPHHSRTTSYSVAAVTGKMATSASACDARHRSISEVADGKRSTSLSRSRSAQSLKTLDQPNGEDKLTILTQLFWIAVSLLESDYEYEFLLASRLLQKILYHLQPERPDCRERLDKILHLIKWASFPGLQTLLLKGCTSQVTSDITWALLSQLTLCISAPVIDPSSALGFPMNIVALLPYLVHHYESPSQVCRSAAEHIAQVCSQQSERLANLATVMSLYSHGTFGKDSFQWTKCVIKYLHDVYSCAGITMVTFLVEVLERGPAQFQPALMQILLCLLHYVDISASPTHTINTQLLAHVTRYLQSPHWREALKILKLAVTRSSTLAAAPPSMPLVAPDLNALITHTSFAEAEISFKKELPGRILDFSVDLSQVSLIAPRHISIDDPSADSGSMIKMSQNSLLALSRKASANTQDSDSGWRRPQSSQARTRERLVNLLTCYGQRVGLPKSPSVIFSQSSDTLEHQPSVASGSSEEASVAELSSDALLNEPGASELLVFKRFDFLNELEENEDDNYNYSSLSNRPQSLCQLTDRSETPTRAQFGSVPDLKLMGSPTEAPLTNQSDSVSLREDEVDESSDEESHSESPAEDGMPHDLPAGGSIIVDNPVLLSSSLTASTHSLHSSYSDGDIMDNSPGTTPPSLAHFTAAFLNTPSDEVQDIWRSHVSKVMMASTPTHTINTCQLFPRLLKELRRRLANLTKESCYYISRSQTLKPIEWQILQILGALPDHTECPLLYTEPETLLGTGLVERHNFCVLEMQECLDTYCMRKDNVEQSLDDIKSFIKQQSLGETNGAVLTDEQKLPLCHSLYKLHFQFVLLYENYCKLLSVFHPLTLTPQAYDASRQVSMVRSHLCYALRELENGQVSPLHVDPQVISKQDAIVSLAEFLTGEQYLKAIQLLRAYRTLWPHDVFGQGCEDDTVALLNIYCRTIAEKHAAIVVLTREEVDHALLRAQLMDLRLQLDTATSQLNPLSHLGLEDPTNRQPVQI